MEYVLGLDIGITSVGWSVVNLDKRRIEDLGVRAFNAAENPKDKSPLAEPRRLARGARRRLRRRAGRMQRAKDLFIETGLISKDARESAFITRPDNKDPWELRADGLDRALADDELARALFHIVKRRGFKSNRKSDKSSDDQKSDKSRENKKALESISRNKAFLQQKDYRTVGEMFHKDERFKKPNPKRNKSDSYSNTVERDMLEDEIKEIFSAQRRLGNQKATPELEKAIIEIFNWQMPFAKGDAILSKVGKCTLEQDELRAPKASYSAERFNLLQNLNNLKIIMPGREPYLEPAEKKLIEELAYNSTDIKYKDIRKKLKLPENARFLGLAYTRRDKEKGYVEDMKCEDRAFCSLKGYHAFKKAFKTTGLWESIRSDSGILNELAYALTFFKTDNDIRAYLSDKGIETRIIDTACDNITGFSGVAHLSTKALDNIIPFMAEGKFYSEACECAGYDHSNPNTGGTLSRKLPPIDPDEIRNPVVLRALTQARKVVNAVIDRYGSPHRIHIEFARDIGRTAEERNKNERRMEENRRANEEDKAHFRETFGAEPVGDMMVKWRLYREQNGQCAYSQKAFDPARIFEPGYAEIDHVLPYSRSFDDSLNNRVLVFAEENRNKKNKTPWEFFGTDEKRWEDYQLWVAASIRNPKKKHILLNKEFAGRNEEDWKARSLADTRYASRYLSNFIKANLLFADPDLPLKVVCFNGRVTALARGLWGIAKCRQENDLHHAVDATVAAMLTPGRIKVITEYRKAQETGELYEVLDEETGEVMEILRDRKFIFPEPWKKFRLELIARLSDDPAAAMAELDLAAYLDMREVKPVVVSRMPIRKADGAIHAETIRSARSDNEGKKISVIRKKLVDLKEGDLNKLYAPEQNVKLYEAIKARMAEHNNDGKKAFAEEFRKPAGDGREAPIVRSVKLYESQPSGVPVREGVADNGDMIRTDVFTKDGKYYLVPVYAGDLLAGKLPDRAITRDKSEDDWLVMDNTYEFIFSLCPYDIVRTEINAKETWGYYRGTDRATGAITLSSVNNNRDKVRNGTKTASAVEKYYIGVLGDIHRVTRERRIGLADRSSIQPGPIEGGQ